MVQGAVGCSGFLRSEHVVGEERDEDSDSEYEYDSDSEYDSDFE